VRKLLYKPLGTALGLAAGLLAGVVFRQVWRAVAGEDDAPSVTDEERQWGEILAAAALQGAIFAVVKAVVDRAGAEGVRRVTGSWPA
jgi:predicted metal-dependent enzyme (double-stranded beta helix superfamily)